MRTDSQEGQWRRSYCPAAAAVPRAAVSGSRARVAPLPGYSCDVSKFLSLTPLPSGDWPGWFCTCHDDSVNYPNILLNDSFLPMLGQCSFLKPKNFIHSFIPHSFTHSFKEVWVTCYILRTVLRIGIIQGTRWKSLP